MSIDSTNLAGVVFSTPMEVPGTLQKEWADLFKVDTHADRIVGLLNKRFLAPKDVTKCNRQVAKSRPGGRPWQSEWLLGCINMIQKESAP